MPLGKSITESNNMSMVTSLHTPISAKPTVVAISWLKSERNVARIMPTTVEVIQERLGNLNRLFT